MQELDANDPPTLGEGRYTLLGLLGEGSMGRTYLAESEGRKVAIKALYPSRLATVKDLQLFVREADVLQKLSHPRIPSYIDAFDEGEGEAVRYHLVQEFVDGETLRSVIVRGDRFDEEQATRLLRLLLAILQYMHSCDPTVVHRDIKPENIILRAADNEPVLVDFGAVREVVRLTMGGGSTIIGTYGYMPPEQLMGRALPASDIYSVGITILEVLTRQTPQDLLGQDVERLISSANVSEGFRRLLRRMCAPSLEDRYADAEHVLGDLDATAGGGALVHAGTIEASMAKRVRDEERALKEASTPGVAQLGYLALISSIVLGAVIGTVLLVNMLAVSFEAAFLAAGVVSGGGLLITLVLLGLRYTHDAWEPPTGKWSKARGTVFNVGAPGPEGVGHGVIYSFPTPGGDFKATMYVTKEDVDAYPIGAQFDVYYQRTNPAYHEAYDISHDPDDVMHRLFNPRVRHTPE